MNNQIVLIIAKYPMGVLSFRFGDTKGLWPVRELQIFNNLQGVDFAIITDPRVREFVRDLSCCLGLRREVCVLRPNGFNVMPDGSLDTAVVIQTLIGITKKVVGEEITVVCRA